jgi:hypothetical protein
MVKSAGFRFLARVSTSFFDKILIKIHQKFQLSYNIQIPENQ